MPVHSGLLRLRTGGHGEVIDLTEGVRSVLGTSGVELGVATVFAPGATVAITTMECEPGAIADLTAVLERLVPSEGGAAGYEHNRLNGDTNAHAHLRAALIGPSESIPIIAGRLGLGTWQQIVLLDFDERPRDRTVSVHIAS